MAKVQATNIGAKPIVFKVRSVLPEKSWSGILPFRNALSCDFVPATSLHTSKSMYNDTSCYHIFLLLQEEDSQQQYSATELQYLLRIPKILAFDLVLRGVAIMKRDYSNKYCFNLNFQN